MVVPRNRRAPNCSAGLQTGCSGGVHARTSLPRTKPTKLDTEKCRKVPGPQVFGRLERNLPVPHPFARFLGEWVR